MKRVKIALGDTPISRLFLTNGNNLLNLANQAITPIHLAFRPMVEEMAFDVSELAIVTAIQKHDDTVSFVGAGSDFSDFTAEDGGIEVYTSNSIFLQDFVHDRVDVDHTFHIFINFDWEKHFKRDLSLQFDLDAFASRNYGTI